MKKQAVLLALAMFVIAWFSGTCMAMRFSEPEKIGGVGSIGFGMIGLTNPTHNTGKNFKKTQNGLFCKGQSKGVALFGDEKDGIYFHYDTYKEPALWAGGKDLANTIKVSCYNSDEIHRIKTDQGITLFPILLDGDITSSFVILGKLRDGTFVKYIDSYIIGENYLGNEDNANYGIYDKDTKEINLNLKVAGDTIIVYYHQAWPRENNNYGEFRFKWDDKAQWFGVEQIIY